jgi:hypothetical protein
MLESSSGTIPETDLGLWGSEKYLADCHLADSPYYSCLANTPTSYRLMRSKVFVVLAVIQ